MKKTYVKKDWSKKEEIVVEYFNFDPNTVTYQELLKLGVSSKTASILIKFRGDKTVFYNHFLDQTNQNKWSYNYKLKKIDYALIPNYLTENKDKYKEWFDL